MKLQAVLFDFDGIIVDSEPLHHKAFARVFKPLKLPITWKRYYEHYLGFDDRDVIRVRFKEADKKLDDDTMKGLIADKAAAFLDIINKDGVTPYPGVADFVRTVVKAVPVAICSGALQGDIDPILNMLKFENTFQVIVTADQVSASKPDPESYRVAFQQLKLKYPDKVDDCELCLAIEDTPAGIAAAKGAGLNVLAVTNTYGAEELADADHIVDSLDGLRLEDLDNILD